MKIIVDTRERRPLWKTNDKKFNVEKVKLNEGDYTTEKLKGKYHAERKSAIDFYGSLIQGHNRFRRELIRALANNTKLIVFVECSSEKFMSKEFQGAARLQVSGGTLAKVICSMTNNYAMEVVWCDGRIDMKKKMLEWFEDLENGIWRMYK